MLLGVLAQLLGLLGIEVALEPQKELLSQDRTNIAYLYTPAIPGNEVASTILDSVSQRLFRGRSNLELSHLPSCS